MPSSFRTHSRFWFLLLGACFVSAAIAFAVGLRTGFNQGFLYAESATAGLEAYNLSEHLIALRAGRLDEVIQNLEALLNYKISIYQPQTRPIEANLLSEKISFGLDNPAELACVSLYRSRFQWKTPALPDPLNSNEPELIAAFLRSYPPAQPTSPTCGTFYHQQMAGGIK